MDIEHIPLETVKAYLLGGLLDDVAATIEEQYFVDRSFFRRMQEVERALIEDYLDGHLAPHEVMMFESRYLRVPALKQIVDEVKQRRAAVADRIGHRRQTLWFALAGALMCAVVCVWIYRNQPRPSQVATGARQQETLAAVTLHLVPGVAKAAGRPAARMDLPPANVPVKLVAELPGPSSPVDCKAQLSVVNADGRLINVWRSARIQATPRNGGRELTLILDPSPLHAGDYILDVTTPDGRVRETYMFRVNSPGP